MEPPPVSAGFSTNEIAVNTALKGIK